MQVTVNGETREVLAGTTVAQLLSSLEVEADHVAVELNAEVVRKARHTETKLSAGDQVEIVTFVGGG